MKIEIIKLTENPLNHIGIVAGTCWNAPIDDETKNIKRANIFLLLQIIVNFKYNCYNNIVLKDEN